MKKYFYSYVSSDGTAWNPVDSSTSLLGAKIICSGTMNRSTATEGCVTKYKKYKNRMFEYCICRKSKGGQWEPVKDTKMKIIEGNFTLQEKR